MTTDTAETRGLSLGARLFLAFGLVLALAVGAAMGVTFYLGQQIATERVTTDLSNSQSVQRYFRELRTRQLEVIAQLVASDPHFSAYINQAIDAADPDLAARSITDQLKQKQNEFDLDLSMVLDPEGRVLARTDRPQALGQDLAGHPMVARARQELAPVNGLWRGQQVLYQATVTPIARGRTVLAYLIAGVAIDDALANDVKRVSGADVAYLAAGEPPQVLATTLDVAATDRLVANLRQRPELLRPVLESAETVQAERLTIEGDRWLVQLSPLLDTDGNAFGAALALTSLDRELAAYREIPMVVLITGVVAIAVALLLSYLISQRILRPVRQLTGAAEAAMEGNYRHQVATSRGDEIGRLSRAFDSLLSDLREKRDIEDYMAEMARHQPETARLAETRPSPAAQSTTPRQEAAAPTDPGVPTDPGAPSESGASSDASGETAVRKTTGGELGERYELLSELGSGGMGVVYKAHDRKLDEVVAIKMLKPGLMDETNMERLKRELKLARRITHPNVLRTYDLGEVDGRPYISMEYVGGMTLRSLLERRDRLPFGAGLRIARQLCAGLAAVHEIGVLHRDIKPENVILEHRGNAKLMDFGIARQVQAPSTMTEAGTFIGTPHYLSPEQLQGQPPDQRSDIYALGVVLEELFTGGLPATGQSTMQIAMAHVHNEPTPPSHFWPDIPGELEAIILRCLAKDPDERFPDVETLAQELGKLRG